VERYAERERHGDRLECSWKYLNKKPEGAERINERSVVMMAVPLMSMLEAIPDAASTQ